MCFSQGDLDEMSSEASLSEEKAQKAMIDAARLADELRAEQEAAQGRGQPGEVGTRVDILIFLISYFSYFSFLPT